MTKTSKKLMICADDFGIAKNINLAIFELSLKKRISAVSCIVSSESSKEDFLKLKSCNNQFFGLHFNLTHDHSVSNIKNCRSPNQSILAVYIDFIKNNFSQKKIENEFKKQWNIFGDLMQMDPDYLDSHHHIHQLPFISDAVLNALSKIGCKSEFFIRNTANLIHLDSLFFKRSALNFFGQKLQKKLKTLKYPTNQNFAGFYDYSRGPISLKIFRSFLSTTKSDTLVMVHPSLGQTDELHDLMKHSRHSEFNLLKSDEFLDLIQQLDFEIQLKIS